MAARDVHNHRNRQVDQPRGITPRETLLMASQGPDAEPVLVAVENGAVTLTLDDGTAVTFDQQELLAAAVDHFTIRCDACGRIGLDKEPDCDHRAAWFVTARGWHEWLRVGEAL